METENTILARDIEYIIDHPWYISDKEWGLHEESLRESLIASILTRLEGSDKNGYSRIWRTQDGEPIAILGAYMVGEKRMETFFLASGHMEEHALRITFEMRRILREQSSNYPGYTCGLYSETDHPNHVNWFRLIGFQYTPEQNKGNMRYFEYKAPRPKRV